MVDTLPIPRGKWGKAQEMTFKTIETQEQLDAIIKDRLERAKESVRKELETELAEIETLKKTVASYEKTADEKDGTIESLQAELKSAKETVDGLTGTVNGLKAEQRKIEIARAVGLPYEMASRLEGADDDELTADAEKLKALIGPKSAPMAGYEKEPANDRRSMIAEMLNSMER